MNTYQSTFQDMVKNGSPFSEVTEAFKQAIKDVLFFQDPLVCEVYNDYYLALFLELGKVAPKWKPYDPEMFIKIGEWALGLKDEEGYPYGVCWGIAICICRVLGKEMHFFSRLYTDEFEGIPSPEKPAYLIEAFDLLKEEAATIQSECMNAINVSVAKHLTDTEEQFSV